MILYILDSEKMARDQEEACKYEVMVQLLKDIES